MSQDLRCPNCGGYKVEGQSVREVSIEHMPSDTYIRMVVRGGAWYIAVFLLGLVISLAASIFLAEQDDPDQVILLLALLLAGVCAVGVIWMLLVTGKEVLATLVRGFGVNEKASLRNLAYCQICGYKWDPARPEPERRPLEQGRLRELGALELDREHAAAAEALRKQQEMAEQAHFLSHRKVRRKNTE